jgi:hypothetical protein
MHLTRSHRHLKQKLDSFLATHPGFIAVWETITLFGIVGAVLLNCGNQVTLIVGSLLYMTALLFNALLFVWTIIVFRRESRKEAQKKTSRK